MSTYGEKVRKYEAKICKANELGLEASKQDLERLVYYYARAEKKGWDYQRKPIQVAKDRIAHIDWQELSKMIGNVVTIESAAKIILKILFR
ncbi:MAG: hypothetical protein BJG00_002775 [Limnothrix sp. CACIAM 69d]|nr:MAG: hypothetical protein BJG00_002775 [Limnothrix sp. CACIAM 69d]